MAKTHIENRSRPADGVITRALCGRPMTDKTNASPWESQYETCARCAEIANNAREARIAKT